MDGEPVVAVDSAYVEATAMDHAVIILDEGQTSCELWTVEVYLLEVYSKLISLYLMYSWMRHAYFRIVNILILTCMLLLWVDAAKI